MKTYVEMSDEEKSKAVEKVRYFGTEYWANRDSSERSEYLADAASAFGYDTWREMPQAEKAVALGAFEAGIAAEKMAVREMKGREP